MFKRWLQSRNQTRSPSCQAQISKALLHRTRSGHIHNPQRSHFEASAADWVAAQEMKSMMSFKSRSHPCRLGESAVSLCLMALRCLKTFFPYASADRGWRYLETSIASVSYKMQMTSLETTKWNAHRINAYKCNALSPCVNIKDPDPNATKWRSIGLCYKMLVTKLECWWPQELARTPGRTPQV